VRLLLDTHIWLWSLLEPDKLTKRLVRELENPSNELWLSAISTWEAVILAEKQRIGISGEISEWIAAALKASPLREAPFTHEVAMELHGVRLAHRDPADRILVATARTFKLTLVTADTRLTKLRDISILANA
jgi:PIN domain nuclease of toxin-antitoxin system